MELVGLGGGGREGIVGLLEGGKPHLLLGGHLHEPIQQTNRNRKPPLSHREDSPGFVTRIPDVVIKAMKAIKAAQLPRYILIIMGAKKWRGNGSDRCIYSLQFIPDPSNKLTILGHRWSLGMLKNLKGPKGNAPFLFLSSDGPRRRPS